MPGPITREIKSLTAQIPSGGYTSNGIPLVGYALAGIIVPVISTGVLTFLVAPSGSPLASTDGPYSPLADKAGNLISAQTPANTGGVALDSVFLNALAGYGAAFKISGAQQTAAAGATFWVHLKG